MRFLLLLISHNFKVSHSRKECPLPEDAIDILPTGRVLWLNARIELHAEACRALTVICSFRVPIKDFSSSEECIHSSLNPRMVDQTGSQHGKSFNGTFGSGVDP